MTSYTVQYELPVDNPEDKVAVRRLRKSIHFFVPINHRSAHLMGYQDLIAAAERSGLVRLVDNP